MTITPEDVQNVWFNMLRSTQAVASKNLGYGVIEIKVVVVGSI